jgi:hypothetical protein
VHIIIGITGSLSWSVIIFKVILIVIAISTPLTIPYISDAEIFWVIYLLLIEL